MCEQKPDAQNSDRSDYDEWVSDLCLDDLEPEEFEALGRYLETGVWSEAEDDDATEDGDEAEDDNGAEDDDSDAKTFFSNPDLRPGSENLGWAHGRTLDGSYYEAELWAWDGQLCVSFLLNEKWEFAPESEFLAQREEERAAAAGEVTYVHSNSDRSELIQGMAIRNESLTQEETARYVDYLMDMGLIEFLTNVCNGYTQALTDVRGNDVIQCVITLESDRFGAEAVTPLRFNPFDVPKRLDSSDFVVVTCGGVPHDTGADGPDMDVESLIDRANRAIAAIPNDEDMTDLERIEYDAEFGYFQEEEEDDEWPANVDFADERVANYVAAAFERQRSGKPLTGAQREVLDSLSDDPDSKVQITWYTITTWENLL